MDHGRGTGTEWSSCTRCKTTEGFHVYFFIILKLFLSDDRSDHTYQDNEGGVLSRGT